MVKNRIKKDVKKELKNCVYSIRLTEEQKDILKKNEWIKRELDKIVIQYINNYL